MKFTCIGTDKVFTFVGVGFDLAPRCVGFVPQPKPCKGESRCGCGGKCGHLNLDSRHRDAVTFILQTLYAEPEPCITNVATNSSSFDKDFCSIQRYDPAGDSMRPGFRYLAGCRHLV